EVPAPGERHEDGAAPRAVVVEEDEAHVDDADVRRDEVAVDETRGVQAADLRAERAEERALRAPVAEPYDGRDEVVAARVARGEQPLAGAPARGDRDRRPEAGAAQRLAHAKRAQRAPAVGRGIALDE